MNEKVKRLQEQGKTVFYAGLEFANNAYQRLQDDLERAYPQPRWQLIVNGQDVGSGVNSRLMDLTLTDNRGLEADTLEINLSDHDGRLELPPKGAFIEVWLGWHTTGLIYKGGFVVNEISHSGSPDVLAIRAMSADLKDTIKAKKERSFDNTTLGKIIEQIAHEHGITAQVHADLANKEIYHLDQNESDINLLTRLADEFDASASIKDDVLLFTPIGLHKTVSGQDLPVAIINRLLGDSHEYSETADNISGVRTHFYDTNKKEKVAILAGDETESVKEIRYVHRDQKSATDTAITTYRKAQRATAHLSYELAFGDANLVPEMAVIVSGLKPQIDAIDWTVTNVKHQLDDQGYTTAIELERTLGQISEVMPPIKVGDPEKEKKKEQKEKEKTDKKKSQGGNRRRQKKQQKRNTKKAAKK